jgi:hypothetical protein
MDRHLQDVPIQERCPLVESDAVTILTVVLLPYRLGERST